MSEDKGWKRHFRLSMFSLEHEEPSRFVRGPWRRRASGVHPLFLIYRLVIALVMIGAMSWSLSVFWNGGKWFIYLTHWGLLISTLETVFGAVLVLQAYRKQTSFVDKCSSLEVSSNDGGGMPLSYKLYWLLYNMALPNAFYISIMYWGLVYNPDNTKSEGPAPLNFMVHAGNSVTALLELLIAGPPSRVLHVVQPLAFGIIYMVFNIIYWAAGGVDPHGRHWIYETLKWENVGSSSLLMVMSATLEIVLHLLVTMMGGLRSRLATKLAPGETMHCTSTAAPIWITQKPFDTGTFNKSFVTDAP